MRLGTTAARSDILDSEQRRILFEAVTYLVRGDDEEDDLQSPIGFEDDAEVVTAVLRRVRQLAEGKNGLGAPDHVTTNSSRALLHAT